MEPSNNQTTEWAFFYLFIFWHPAKPATREARWRNVQIARQGNKRGGGVENFFLR